MRFDVGGLVALIVINLLLPVFVGGIDWRAHVGGLLAGMVVGALFAYPPASVRTPVAVVGSLVVLVACVVLVAYRTQAIKDDPRYGPMVEQLEGGDASRPLPTGRHARSLTRAPYDRCYRRVTCRPSSRSLPCAMP